MKMNAVEAVGTEDEASPGFGSNYESASFAMYVPDVCIDGFCKLVLYKNASIGAYASGYVWEVYYLQFSDSNSWIGGPNVCLGGFCYNDGQGINGNGLSEGVILGGETSDGGYIRILDDGDSENFYNQWTVEYQSSPSLNQVFLQACPITGCTWETVSENTIIPVPDFCDSEYPEFCLITRYTDGTFGAFGPGFSLPAYINGDVEGSDNEWLGGPNVSIGGMDFSSGSGTNGDGIAQALLAGGQAAGGGYAGLYDDGLESSDDAWSIFFEGDGELTTATFEFCPMYWNEKHTYYNELPQRSSEVNWTEDTPTACINAQYIAYNNGSEQKIPYELSFNQFAFNVSGDLVDVDAIDGGGTGVLCDTAGVGDLTGKIALISRGSCPFATKINNAESLGAAAVIVYNNEPGDFYMDTSGSSLPAGSITQADGLALKAIAPIAISIGPDANFCTLLTWTDAWMGAFGPGINWPIYYEQNTLDDTWLGGPALKIAGIGFSDGGGTNGDQNLAFVAEGGLTNPNLGYFAIHDDQPSVGETSPDNWNVVFNPQDDLTTASYTVFPETCSKIPFFNIKQVFEDVSQSYWAFAWISRLYRAGITTGCSTDPMKYCPENNVSRAQMAIFLEKAKRGADYYPPSATGTIFGDVLSTTFAADWIELLVSDKITSGCQMTPRKYCPFEPVSRAQMAIFLLKAKYGGDYSPDPIKDGTGFSDVSITDPAAPYIKQLVAEGITAGCGGDNYCPTSPVTREQMAAFLVKAFGIQ
jgi:hypothetical protein